MKSYIPVLSIIIIGLLVAVSIITLTPKGVVVDGEVITEEIELPVSRYEATQIASKYCYKSHIPIDEIPRKVGNEWRIRNIFVNCICDIVININTGETKCAVPVKETDSNYCEQDSDCEWTNHIHYLLNGEEVGPCQCLNKEFMRTHRSSHEVAMCPAENCKCINNICSTGRFVQ
jgi:hypothetical protein